MAIFGSGVGRNISAGAVVTDVIAHISRDTFAEAGRYMDSTTKQAARGAHLRVSGDLIKDGFERIGRQFRQTQAEAEKASAGIDKSLATVNSAFDKADATSKAALTQVRDQLVQTKEGIVNLSTTSSESTKKYQDDMAQRMRAAEEAGKVERAEMAKTRADMEKQAVGGGMGGHGGGGSKAAMEAAGGKAAGDYKKGFEKAANLGKWTVLGSALFGVATVKAAANFEKQMEMIHTQAGASQKEVEKLNKEVLKMAPAVGVGPTKLAEGLFHLESAGFRGAKAMEMLKMSAEAARVGNAGMEETTNALSAVMRTNLKDIHGSAEAVGVMNDIVGQGNMHFKDLVGAMTTQLLPAGKAVGLGFRDLGAALDVMTTRGTPAEEAATRLRTALGLVANPTAKAQKALLEVGVQSEDLAKKMRTEGLAGAIEYLQKKMDQTFGKGAPLSGEQFKKAMEQYKASLAEAGITGSAAGKALEAYEHKLKGTGETAIKESRILAEAFGGARIGTTFTILAQNVDDLRKHTEGLNKAGAAQRFQKDWEATEKTFSEKMAKMWAGVQKLGIEVGEYLIPKVEKLGEMIGEAANWLGKHQDILKGLIILMGGVLSAAVTAFFLKWTMGIAKTFKEFGSFIKYLTGSGKATKLAADERVAQLEAEQAVIKENMAMWQAYMGEREKFNRIGELQGQAQAGTISRVNPTTGRMESYGTAYQRQAAGVMGIPEAAPGPGSVRDPASGRFISRSALFEREIAKYETPPTVPQMAPVGGGGLKGKLSNVFGGGGGATIMGTRGSGPINANNPMPTAMVDGAQAGLGSKAAAFSTNVPGGGGKGSSQPGVVSGGSSLTAEEKAAQAAGGLSGGGGGGIKAKLGSFAGDLKSAIGGLMGNLMKGAMLASFGTLASEIAGSAIGGSKGQAVAGLGKDISLGAGAGMIFGPEGAVAGGVLGGIVGGVKEFIGKGETEGQKIGKALGKGVERPVAEAVTNTIDTANKKIAKEKEEKEHPHRKGTSVQKKVSGFLSDITGGLVEEVESQGEEEEKAKNKLSPGARKELNEQKELALQEAGQKAGRGVVGKAVKEVSGQHLSQGNYLLAIIGRMESTLKDNKLPEQARAAAGKTILDMVKELEAKKQLPVKSVDAVVAALGSRFPKLKKYAEQAGKESMDALAAANEGHEVLKKAEGFLKSLGLVYKEFPEVVHLNGENAVQEFKKADQKLQQEEHSSSALRRLTAQEDRKRLQKEEDAWYNDRIKNVDDRLHTLNDHNAKKTQKGNEETAVLFQARAELIGKKLEAGIISSDQAAKQLNDNFLKEMKDLGATPAEMKKVESGIGKFGKDIASKVSAGIKLATGGIPHPGSGGADDHILMDPTGRPVAALSGTEGILNRPQMNFVNSLMQASSQMGMSPYSNLNDLWSSGMKHYASGGQLGSTGYVFPFPKGEKFGWDRIDQGQDLQGPPGGKVIAIAPGNVTVGHDVFGGFGPFYPVESISSGPWKGRSIYYGHVKDTRTGPVKPGDVIGVTQSRADEWTAAPAGWLELGFTSALGGGIAGQGAAVSPMLHALAAGHMVSGMGGGEGAQFKALTEPKWSGPGGLLGEIGKAIIKKTTKAANARLKKLAASAGGAGVGGAVGNVQSASASSIKAALQRAGLSATVAGGITRALYAESALSTTNMGGEGAFGLAQWLGPRLTGLRQYASQHHKSVTSPALQLEYLMEELHGPEASTLRSLQGLRSEEEVTKRFVELFERPAVSNIPAIMQRAMSLAKFATGGLLPGFQTGGTGISSAGTHPGGTQETLAQSRSRHKRNIHQRVAAKLNPKGTGKRGASKTTRPPKRGPTLRGVGVHTGSSRLSTTAHKEAKHGKAPAAETEEYTGPLPAGLSAAEQEGMGMFEPGERGGVRFGTAAQRADAMWFKYQTQGLKAAETIAALNEQYASTQEEYALPPTPEPLVTLTEADLAVIDPKGTTNLKGEWIPGPTGYAPGDQIVNRDGMEVGRYFGLNESIVGGKFIPGISTLLERNTSLRGILEQLAEQYGSQEGAEGWFIGSKLAKRARPGVGGMFAGGNDQKEIANRQDRIEKYKRRIDKVKRHRERFEHFKARNEQHIRKIREQLMKIQEGKNAAAVKKALSRGEIVRRKATFKELRQDISRQIADTRTTHSEMAREGATPKELSGFAGMVTYLQNQDRAAKEGETRENTWEQEAAARGGVRAAEQKNLAGHLKTTEFNLTQGNKEYAKHIKDDEKEIKLFQKRQRTLGAQQASIEADEQAHEGNMQSIIPARKTNEKNMEALSREVKELGAVTNIQPRTRKSGKTLEEERAREALADLNALDAASQQLFQQFGSNTMSSAMLPAALAGGMRMGGVRYFGAAGGGSAASGLPGMASGGMLASGPASPTGTHETRNFYQTNHYMTGPEDPHIHAQVSAAEFASRMG